MFVLEVFEDVPLLELPEPLEPLEVPELLPEPELPEPVDVPLWLFEVLLDESSDDFSDEEPELFEEFCSELVLEPDEAEDVGVGAVVAVELLDDPDLLVVLPVLEPVELPDVFVVSIGVVLVPIPCPDDAMLIISAQSATATREETMDTMMTLRWVALFRPFEAFPLPVRPLLACCVSIVVRERLPEYESREYALAESAGLPACAASP